MSQRIHLDANVILRFLRNDDARQTAAATRLFQKAASGKASLFVSAVTINEVFFAFTSFYKLSQTEVARKIIPFIRTGVAEFEYEDCLLDALQRVSAEDVDFGDAYLAAFAAKHKDQIASFDRDFKRFKDSVAQKGGGFAVKDGRELTAKIIELLGDEKLRIDAGRKAYEAVQSQKGAVAKTVVLINSVLATRPEAAGK